MRRNIIIAFAIMFYPAVANATWQRADSKHFMVYSDETADNLRTYATKLERFDAALRKLHAVPETQRGKASRVTVYVLKNVSAVQKLYGRDTVAGYYQARASGPVAFVPKQSDGLLSAQAVFFHEYTHHFMFNDWPSALFPKWFTEGFAEFHATALFGDDGSVTFGAPPYYRRYSVHETNWLPASQLLKPDPGKLDEESTDALYSRGWLLIHYMTFDAARRAKLAAYIQAINDGKSSKEAIALIGNPNNLDVSLNAYLERPKFRSIRFTANELTVGQVEIKDLTPGEAATMPIQIASSNGVDEKTASKIAILAQQLAANFPNDAGAQNALAEAQYDAAQFINPEGKKAAYSQALVAAERALAADPTSIHALLHKGMILQAIAELSKSTDVESWRLIRRCFISANRLDPENPEPLILYYNSFDAAKELPTRQAEDGFLYAFALAPFDVELRIPVGKLQLRRNNVIEARKVLLPVIYSAESGPIGDKLRGVLASLDNKGAAAALAEIEQIEADAKAAIEKRKKGGKV